MKASPQFLGPMKCLKGSGFKHGMGLVPSFNLPEHFFRGSVGVGSPAPTEQAERLLPWPWLPQEPVCFWEAALAVGAPCHFLQRGSP